MEPIYIVVSTMSSPNRVLSSELKNEGMTLEVNYSFEEEKRKKIAAIRTRHKKPIYQNCLEWHTIYLCNQIQKAEIQEASNTADRELKEIDSTLKAELLFIGLDMNEVKKGETYEAILMSIEFQVMNDVIEKLADVAKDKTGGLPERSKEAMLKLVERLRSINVLGDKNIDTKLQKIKDKIINNDLETLKIEFNKEIAVLKTRGAFLEFREDKK